MIMIIDNYKFGRIVIDGKAYTKDLIIFPDRIKRQWWRDEGHLLQVQDLSDVWEEKLDKLIVGKGANRRMKISKGVENKCQELGIELTAKKSSEACEEYNQLSKKEKENSILAIHLTC